MGHPGTAAAVATATSGPSLLSLWGRRPVRRMMRKAMGLPVSHNDPPGGMCGRQVYRLSLVEMVRVDLDPVSKPPESLLVVLGVRWLT